MLCLNINILHFEKQIWFGKLLKYLKSGWLKLLPRRTLRQKLDAVRGRNCISVLMPVNAVCCCHLLLPGCRRWCHSAWWHGSFVGISADGLWQEWAKRKKGKKTTFSFFSRIADLFGDSQIFWRSFDECWTVKPLLGIVILISLSQYICTQDRWLWDWNKTTLWTDTTQKLRIFKFIISHPNDSVSRSFRMDLKWFNSQYYHITIFWFY